MSETRQSLSALAASKILRENCPGAAAVVMTTPRESATLGSAAQRLSKNFSMLLHVGPVGELEALAMARGANDADHARIEAAERKIADCDKRLAKYRATLGAGADPVVAGWMAEVQGERLRAEQEIGKAQPGGQLTRDQVRKLVTSLKDIVAALADADPKLKAEVYEELGITVTYKPNRHVALIESRPANPWATVSVGGGT